MTKAWIKKNWEQITYFSVLLVAFGGALQTARAIDARVTALESQDAKRIESQAEIKVISEKVSKLEKNDEQKTEIIKDIRDVAADMHGDIKVLLDRTDPNRTGGAR